VKKIVLRNRAKQIVGVAVVDDEDYERLAAFRWHLTASGHVARSIRKANGTYGLMYMHRDIFHLVPGDGKEVDHKRGDRKWDNRKRNLRVVTHAQNHQNRGVLNRNNVSGHRGINWDKARGKWMARIKLNYKTVYCQRFDNLDEAITAVTAERKRIMPYSIEP
jgi:hypothetical protein